MESAGAVPTRAEPVFGDYTLVRPIADGGMASVYLARLRRGEFAKWVALKLIHPRYTGDERFERMFLSEARIVAHVDHPNVCSVFDFGRVDGQAYLAMEYLRGQTVLRVVKTARDTDVSIPPSFWARVIADAALGLHAAHEARNETGRPLNLVHRDISPHNLMVLYSGVTKVLDFGIAKTAEPEESDLTAMDELKGKLSYMSPEQMRREPLDRRSDVFALGATLWEATCAKPLFRRGNKGDTVLAVLQDPVPLPSTVVPDYPPELEAIIMRALARNPDERWASAADFAHELEEFIRTNETPCGHRDVSRLMDRLFHDEIESSHSDLEQIATRAEKLSRDVVSGISPSRGCHLTHRSRQAAIPRIKLAILVAVVLIAGAVGLVVTEREPEEGRDTTVDPTGSVASPPQAVSPATMDPRQEPGSAGPAEADPIPSPEATEVAHDPSREVPAAEVPAGMREKSRPRRRRRPRNRADEDTRTRETNRGRPESPIFHFD